MEFNENDIRQMVAESVRRIINEKFKSPRLAQLAKDNGGLSVWRNGGKRGGVDAFQYGRTIDPSQVTDDMLVGEPFDYNDSNIPQKQKDNAIYFNATGDGQKGIGVRTDMEIPKPRRKYDRYGSGVGDTGDHDKHIGGFKSKESITQGSAPYNGYSVSDRAGEGQVIRNVISNNKKDLDYWNEHPEDDRMMRMRMTAKGTIADLKRRARGLLNREK